MTFCAPAGLWLTQTEAQIDDVITLCRAIHMDPEIGLRTSRTTPKIREMLRDRPWRCARGHRHQA